MGCTIFEQGAGDVFTLVRLMLTFAEPVKDKPAGG
jgi:hypothetical protein